MGFKLIFNFHKGFDTLIESLSLLFPAESDKRERMGVIFVK